MATYINDPTKFILRSRGRCKNNGLKEIELSDGETCFRPNSGIVTHWVIYVQYTDKKGIFVKEANYNILNFCNHIYMLFCDAKIKIKPILS